MVSGGGTSRELEGETAEECEMKASETPLLSLLKGPKQFLIPIYQRTYSWTEKECSQLWSDVARVGTDGRYAAHFIGSVVYIEHGLYQATSLPRLLVIDGQQRLATVALLIEALARSLDGREEGGSGAEVTSRKLRNYFLFNAEEEGQLRYKLLLSKGDVESLQALVDGKPLPDRPARHLVENFEYFRNRLASSGLDPLAVYRGLSKLLIVDISLDREHDNPQLIFESLNSTGLELSQADLVRNFVLMGLEPTVQEELYRTYWFPMEQRFVLDENPDVFDRFLRAWLTIRLGEVPNVRRGYEEFKRYRAAKAEVPIADLLEDLHRFSGHYAAIALGGEEDRKLKAVFDGLRQLRIDVPLPFLMARYDDWKAGRLSYENLIAVATLIESWLFRRSICDIPSNVLSRTFAALPSMLEQDRLVESFQALLLVRGGRQRFPRDDEFRAALLSRNLYEARHRNYCLSKLENHGRKEPVDASEYTIEHVLPQNEKLSAAWQTELGDRWQLVRERWLHTLGNLTLTGYNPELSDKPFREKQEMPGGFRDSPLRLNKDLAQAKRWDEAAIERRARSLATKAVEIWPVPTASDEVIAEYRESLEERKTGRQWDLEHFKSLQGQSRSLYMEFRERAGKIGLVEFVMKNFIGFGLPHHPRPYVAIVWPRREFLLAQAHYPFAELDDPPPEWFGAWKGRRTRVKMFSIGQMDDFVELVAKVAESAGAAPR